MLELILMTLATIAAPLDASSDRRPASSTESWDQREGHADLLDHAGDEDILSAAARLQELGGELAAAGYSVEAETMLEESLRAYRATVGDSLPVVGQVLAGLAWIHARQYRDARAAVLCKKALTAIGGNHDAAPKQTVFCLAVLAFRARAEKKMRRAEKMYQRAVAIADANLPPADDSTIYALEMLAETLELRGKNQKALAVRRDVVDRLQTADVPLDRRVPGALARYGLLLVQVDKPDEAVPVLELALDTNGHTGPQMPTRGMVLAGLGLAYWLSDHPYRAVEIYDEALSTVEPESPNATGYVVAVLHARAAVLEEVHRGVDAVLDRYRALALEEGDEQLPRRARVRCDTKRLPSCG